MLEGWGSEDTLQPARQASTQLSGFRGISSKPGVGGGKDIFQRYVCVSQAKNTR